MLVQCLGKHCRIQFIISVFSILALIKLQRKVFLELRGLNVLLSDLGPSVDRQ